MRLEWFKSSARCRTAQRENMPASQHTAVAESPVCRHNLWLSVHPTSQRDVGHQQESQDQVRSRRQIQRDLAGAEWFRKVGIGDNGAERVGHLTDATTTVRFKKIYNPGDRPRSLASYRMSTRALPGKTHCELEEIFRAKAGKMTTHSR